MTDAPEPQTSAEPGAGEPIELPPVGGLAAPTTPTGEVPAGPAVMGDTQEVPNQAPQWPTQPGIPDPATGAGGGSGAGNWGGGPWGPGPAGPWGAPQPGPWGAGQSGPWGPPATTWTAPPPPAPPAVTPAAGSSPGRRSRLIGGAAVLTGLATLAGVGIGYAVWQPSGSTPAAARTPLGGSGSTSTGSGSSGSGSTNPFEPRDGSGSTPFGNGSSGRTGSSGSSSGGSTSSAAGSPSNLSSIAAEVDPGLVDINTTLSYQDEQAAGTGMVLTSTGEVLTNNHVIEGATSISVTDIGNGKTYTGTVVGYDRTDDVAVVKLQGASGLQTVTTGNSSNVAVGQGVVGIGNAGGAGGQPSVAGGSVTALNQSITASDEGDDTSEQLTDLIEVNCNIEPGDSGGPLVNTSGQVLGMDTAAASGSGSEGFTFEDATGQGYAIPIDRALTLAKEIEASTASSTVHIGKTAFLGVEISPTTGQATTGGGSSREPGGYGGYGNFGDGSSPFGSTDGAGGRTTATGTATTTGSGSTTTGGQSSSGTSGAEIAGVVSGTPAAKAGLARGDVITAVDGKTVTSADSLTTVMEGYHPGDKVQVSWTDSSGQQHTATVTLATGPAD